jgi:hypothetical protein
MTRDSESERNRSGRKRKRQWGGVGEEKRGRREQAESEKKDQMKHPSNPVHPRAHLISSSWALHTGGASRMLRKEVRLAILTR